RTAPSTSTTRDRAAGADCPSADCSDSVVGGVAIREGGADAGAARKCATPSTSASRHPKATRACLRESVNPGMHRACPGSCDMSVTERHLHVYAKRLLSALWHRDPTKTPPQRGHARGQDTRRNPSCRIPT